MERPRPITVKRARELLDQHGIATCCDGPYRARVVTVRDDGHGMRIWLQYPDASKATGVAYESHPIHRVYDADEWDRWMASRSMGEQAAYAKAWAEQQALATPGMRDALRAQWDMLYAICWQRAHTSREPVSQDEIRAEYYRIIIDAYAPWSPAAPVHLIDPSVAAGFASTRHMLGLSGAQLAEILGVADRTIRRWEAGQDRIPAGVAMTMCRLQVEAARDVRAIVRQAHESMDSAIYRIVPVVTAYRTDAEYQAAGGVRPVSWHRAAIARAAAQVPGLRPVYAGETGIDVAVGDSAS